MKSKTSIVRKKKPEKTLMVAVRINGKHCSVFTFTKKKDRDDFLTAIMTNPRHMDIEWSVPIQD